MQKEPKGDIWERSEQKTNERSELMGGYDQKGSFSDKERSEKHINKHGLLITNKGNL